MNESFARFPTLGRWAAVLLAGALLLPQTSWAQGVTKRYRPDRLILLPKRGANTPGLQKKHLQGGRRVLNAFSGLGGLQVIQLAPGEKLAEAALGYMSSGLAEFVEPDYKLHASDIPNDPEFTGGTQWALRNSSNPGHDISAVSAWDTTHSASNVVVAIIDSGIRVTHNDLAANLWTNPREIDGNGRDDDNNGIVDDLHGINAIDSSGDVNDDAGHGTHVAGIIGAAGNNGIGITGVAWNVRLMACKFLDQNGDGDTSDAIRCVDYARRNGAQIINASWGGGDYSAALNSAIASARAAGIIFVTAAGNDSQNIDEAPLYPACYTLDNIVVVGGTGRTDALDTSYSNFGAVNVDLCAPGTSIYSTWNSWDGAYTYLSGTSMAAPHVAGALALMRARFPTFSPNELINRLLSTVDVLPALAGKCLTSGRLNLARALGTDPTANFAASRWSGEPPLAVSFTNTTLGELSSVAWDFGDGTEASSSANPTHVFAKSGVFNVRLTVVGTNHRTNSLEQKVTAVLNYDVADESYEWVDPSAMTPLALSDNGVSPPKALPFAFRFYGLDYSTIYIGANGLLGFNSAGFSTTGNSSIPNASTPNAMLCPYWDNLNPAAGGTIYYGVAGDEPKRRFVVSWMDVPRNSTGVKITFQAILEEGSNEIVFQYLEVAPASTRGGAKGATVGLENETGSTGVLYTLDGNPHVLANETALRFKPHAYNYLVADRSGLTFNGVAGRVVAGLKNNLLLSNPGTAPLAWTLESSEPWLRASVSNGELQGGASTPVDLSLGAEVDGFALGEYAATLNLLNQAGGGSVAIPVLLKIEQEKASLALRNVSGTQFAGGLGGPFLPSVLTVELANDGNVPVDWKESTGANWLMANPSDGQIEPGQSVFVEISAGPAADAFGSGVTNGVVSFESVASGQKLEQSFQLEVRSRVAQTAANLVNGVFSGAIEVAEGGAAYQVEFSDDLQNWFPLDGPAEIKNGALLFQDATLAGTQRFYRVRVD